MFGSLNPQRSVEQRARQHQFLNSAGMGQQVFDRKRTAPGVTEDADAPKPKCLPYRIYLTDKELDGPKGWIIRAVGLATTELVIQDHGLTMTGHQRKRLH